jgi:hypothetical protein
MLTENQVKEQLSVAYVNAVAAICNFACEFTRIDIDSIDVSITCNGNLAADSIIRSPEIKIQLKATENLSLNAANEYPFALPIKNYDDLRANTLTPRLLVVLNLPNIRDGWVSHSINDLIIRNCAFWLNLKGKASVANTSNITVHLPSINVFSPNALKELMLKVSRQEAL